MRKKEPAASPHDLRTFRIGQIYSTFKVIKSHSMYASTRGNRSKAVTPHIGLPAAMQKG